MARAFLKASSQYLSNATPPIGDTPFSVSCWARTDSITVSDFAIVCQADSTSDTDSYWWLIFAGGTASDPMRFYLRGSSLATTTADSSGSYSADTWHSCVGIATSDSEVGAHIDGGGSEAPTTQEGGFNSFASSNIISVGSFQRASPLYANVDVAELGIWDVALSTGERLALAAGYSPLQIRPQSLIRYWPLIGRTSPEIDLVGGYDMTLNAAPTTAAHPRAIYPSRQIYTPPILDTGGLSVNISPGANYIQVV